MVKQKIRLMLLAFSIPTLTFSANQRLYWQAPLINRGGLCDTDSDQISEKWVAGWLGAHYRLSPAVGLTGSLYTYSDYEEGDREYKAPYIYDGSLKWNPIKVRLFSKVAHIYVQVGGWKAKSKALPEKKDLKGSGLLLGGGGYCDLSSRFFVDLSYKGLIGVSLLGTQNMSNMNIFSLGLGIRLYPLH